MTLAQDTARLLVHMEYPDAEVEATMRRKFPDEDVDALLAEARMHKDYVDARMHKDYVDAEVTDADRP